MSPDELVAEHLELPPMLANTFYRTHNQYEELVSEGFLALVRCSRRYDPTKNASFRSYATHRILGSMRDWIRLPYRKHEPKEMLTLSVEGSATAAPPQEPFIELIDMIGRLRDGSVVLRYAFGATLIEIGKQDGYTETRACQRLRRGRDDLKILLGMT